MNMWIDLHNDYSLYEHTDDVRYEKDLQELKREVLRQRIYIEQQHAEIHKLNTEIALLRGLRSLERRFANE